MFAAVSGAWIAPRGQQLALASRMPLADDWRVSCNPAPASYISLFDEVSLSIERRANTRAEGVVTARSNARGCHGLQIGLAGCRLPPECIAQSTGGSEGM